MPLPARNPSTNRAPSAAGVPGVSALPTRCDTASASHVPDVVEQPASPGPHEPVDRPAVGELGEGVREVAVAGGVVEHRQRALQPTQPFDHRRRSIVVEVPAARAPVQR